VPPEERAEDGGHGDAQSHPHNIALADDQGQSYAPTDFDKRGGSTDEGPP